MVPEFVRLAAHPLRWRLLSLLAAGDLRVRELVAMAGEPQNLVSYHLRLLREAGLVSATRSTRDGRDSYYHLDLTRCGDGLAAAGAALHPSLGPRPGSVRQGIAVLFVCTGNSARSPIAEALLRHHAGGRVRAASAGVRPKERLHPSTVRVLREEFGVAPGSPHPRDVRTLARRRFDHVITLCDKAREDCPDLGGRRTHWSIPEPEGYESFRATAAEIDVRVRHLLPALT
ncbi:ArsR family transcriptional regulator [Amycolatopsis deserti]|uniref:ArsR family transcriptional regulator n=1 Tax=Amycolatopsis deserti TaxID=185696 RepID=A0ABQ3IJV7_9PSEU|nr:metalloregulator ArsR/SmtB family transcription factor [Amycolatopsis deserti]GHE84177.1 ArsR family transcriptional regulator [Amycolatopsis deserti]